MMRDVVRAVWAVAQALTLIALALVVKTDANNKDAHAVWLSASDLLKQAEYEGKK